MDPEPRLVVQGGRLKAYRPISPAAREAAFEAGLKAYARGEFFEAHELLEPAWMGTADIPERELYQGLIKLAAAFVHVGRDNPVGATKNLRGARTRLTRAIESDADDHGLDLPGLVADIDAAIDATGVGGADAAGRADAWPIEPPRLVRRDSPTTARPGGR